MNPFARGALLATLTVGLSLLLPDHLVAPLFALLLAFAAAVYVGFAEVDQRGDHTSGVRRLQWGVALAFVGIALLGLWISPSIIAAGWFLHAGWDLLHHRRVLRTRTAEWYPGACLAYDLVVAGFVALWTWPPA